MRETYKLVGILDLFGVVPNFVYPVFEKNGQYYFLVCDKNFKEIERFEPVKDSCVSRIVYLSNLKTNMFQQTDFSKNSEPIFVFQLSEDEIFVAPISEAASFFETFKTENSILKKKIADFLNIVGTE